MEAEAVVTSKGHGRLERREIRTSEELVGYSDFPGLAQVAQVNKRVVICKTGEVKETTHYFITSRSAEAADPSQLLADHRGHWGIENRLFHVKDDSFGEDRQVLGAHRSGAIMSLLRTTAIALLRGKSALWSSNEPLTGRAQALAASPLKVVQGL